MRCDHCGSNNFNWARTCNQCHAPLRPDAVPQARDPAVPEPATERAPAPFAPPLLDAEAAERAAFAQTLFQATPQVYVTWALVALNVAVFIAMLAAGTPPSGGDSASLMRWGALYGPAVSRGEWWRLLTAMFVHGGLLHLFANMYVLIGIGPLTERLYGNVGYAILYLLSGIAGGLVGLYLAPGRVIRGCLGGGVRNDGSRPGVCRAPPPYAGAIDSAFVCKKRHIRDCAQPHARFCPAEHRHGRAHRRTRRRVPVRTPARAAADHADVSQRATPRHRGSDRTAAGRTRHTSAARHRRLAGRGGRSQRGGTHCERNIEGGSAIRRL